MNTQNTRRLSGMTIILILETAIVLAGIAWLAHLTWVTTTPFDTDEADHANAALELFHALRAFSPGAIYHAVVREAFYPPLNSFVVAASYLLAGPSLAAARIPSTVLFGVYLALLGAASYRCARPTGRGLTAAIITIALAAQSPITLYHTTICMLEMAGLALTAWMLYFASKQATLSSRTAFVLGIFAAASFLEKYSFGLFLMPGVLCALFFAPPVRIHPREIVSVTRWRASLPAIFAIVGIIAIWLCVTDRASVWHFFVGHKSYAPMFSAENLFFDIHSWFTVYSLNFVIAATALLLGAAAICWGWELLAIRCAFFTALFALIVLELSTVNEERHFIIAAPCIWLLAGYGAVQLAQRVSSVTRVLGALLIALPIIFGMYTSATSVADQIAGQFEGDPRYGDLQKFIADNVKVGEHVLVNGVQDDFGIEALRWRIAVAQDIPYTSVAADSYPFRPDKIRTAIKRKRNVDYPAIRNGFPRSPLRAVIQAGYYDKAVQIEKAGHVPHFKAEADEFSETLKDFTALKKSDADLTITIATLKNQSGPTN